MFHADISESSWNLQMMWISFWSEFSKHAYWGTWNILIANDTHTFLAAHGAFPFLYPFIFDKSASHVFLFEPQAFSVTSGRAGAWFLLTLLWLEWPLGNEVKEKHNAFWCSLRLPNYLCVSDRRNTFLIQCNFSCAVILFVSFFAPGTDAELLL